jgi:hypothetical protein
MTSTWTPVSESLPLDDKPVVLYTEIWGVYDLGSFNPIWGWRALNGESLKTVTHWLDADLQMPWPWANKFNEEVARTYGYKAPAESDD